MACLNADIFANFFFFPTLKIGGKKQQMNKSKEMVFYARDSKTTESVLFLNNTRTSCHRVHKTERKQSINKTK